MFFLTSLALAIALFIWLNIAHAARDPEPDTTMGRFPSNATATIDQLGAVLAQTTSHRSFFTYCGELCVHCADGKHRLYIARAQRETDVNEAETAFKALGWVGVGAVALGVIVGGSAAALATPVAAGGWGLLTGFSAWGAFVAGGKVGAIAGGALVLAMADAQKTSAGLPVICPYVDFYKATTDNDAFKNVELEKILPSNKPVPARKADNTETDASCLTKDFEAMREKDAELLKNKWNLPGVVLAFLVDSPDACGNYKPKGISYASEVGWSFSRMTTAISSAWNTAQVASANECFEINASSPMTSARVV